MRDIKFRAWYYAEKKMYYDVVVFDGCVCKRISEDIWDNFYDEDGPREDAAVIPMQYTGLKDKNGKDIYEGDIVKVGSILMQKNPDYNAIRTVSWGGEINGSEWTHDIIGFTLEPCDNHRIPNLDNDKDLNIEVIGNIYEKSKEKE